MDCTIASTRLSDLPRGQPTHDPMMIGCPKYRCHRLPLRRTPAIVWW